jgi:UDP-glucose 4-epimerase
VTRGGTLAGARVLVTGGAGLIGSHIVDEVLAAGAAEVRVLDNFSRGSRDNLAAAAAAPALQVIEGDLADRPLLADVMRGVDVVFHQAAIRITRCAREPRLALEVLVDGTFNVCEAAVDAGVGKVVAASSASVYGLAEEFPTSERHHPYNNRTIYGAAKAFNEALLRSFHEMHGLDYVALRYFNVYGPRMDAEGAYTEVMIRWMERLEAGQPPVIFGEGGQTMDFVSVEDVARANLAAAVAPVTDDVFNVASGVETSLAELAAALARAMGVDLAPERGPVRGVAAVPRRLADTSRARRLLGWQARVSLAEGLERLVAWWRARPSGLPREQARAA